MHTIKQSLEALFDAMHHGKRDFSDFASCQVEPNYVRHEFRKQGKTRVVLNPNEKLRAYHEFLRLFLFDFLPVRRDVVFSYRKGVSAYDAVIKHAGSKHFFVCDIADFFPSISRDRIRRTIVAGGNSTPILDIDQWVDRVLDLVSVEDALPLGFSTSPSISNSALLPLDDAIQRHCVAHDLIYTRYSDDIVVSAVDAERLRGVEGVLATCFAEHMEGDMALNPAKSKLLHTGGKIRILGMVLLPNGTVSVDASVKSEIEVLIHFYIRDRRKFADRVEGDAKKAEARLAGLLNYVNTVDRAYLQKLRKKFGAAVVDLFLHRSFG
jgi:RNA-directed DNA polymerase